MAPGRVGIGELVGIERANPLRVPPLGLGFEVSAEHPYRIDVDHPRGHAAPTGPGSQTFLCGCVKLHDDSVGGVRPDDGLGLIDIRTAHRAVHAMTARQA